MGVTMQSVRDQFWLAVDQSLRYGFRSEEIQRVLRFCAFCRQVSVLRHSEHLGRYSDWDIANVWTQQYGTHPPTHLLLVVPAVPAHV